MNTKIITGLFLGLLFGISLINALTPSREFSENENRVLAQIPAFSAESLFNGKYTQGFDKYVTDQFVLRDAWVGLKTFSELALGRKASNGVYLVKGGVLIDMFDTADMEQFEKNIGYVSEFSVMANEKLGADVTTILVPSAAMIFEDRLPAFAPEIDQRYLLNCATERIPGFIDVTDTLLEHKDEYIYYMTDHHWTSQGAFYAYNAWLAGRGAPKKKIENYSREILSGSFYGTTYSKASLYTLKPDSITAFYPKSIGEITVDYNRGEKVSDSIYELSYLEAKDKYSVFFNANQPVTRVSTGKHNGKKLLIIKDSYANTFAQFAIEDFEEVFMLDLRYFSDSVHDFAASGNITDILVLYSLKGFSSDTNIFRLAR